MQLNTNLCLAVTFPLYPMPRFPKTRITFTSVMGRDHCPALLVARGMEDARSRTEQGTPEVLADQLAA